MKHALIIGHPDAEGFTQSVAAAYAQTVQGLGHQTVIRDLYRLEFDPRLQSQERSDRPGYAPASDVVVERQAIGDADVFAFFYPLWFNMPPAIIKGYVDRVFGAGFGYRALHAGGMDPLLKGRSMITFTSSGSSRAWLEEQGCWLSLRNLFDDYLARLCGMTVVDHVHFPSITAGLDKRWVDENLAATVRRAKEAFGGGSEGH
ncbi:NAD(P)H-dependent oxidoreductase [Caulobacter sp. NIBR2454]|uniref:NAD(P)H-dependent oxidoreductase n=1 Tax=Caulobacter sp. NIBR2454 TaxID=3015996 RepID=UPI0022B70F06|nr:NAD(P)H-dependent oxidoreductase [Caulobacter sp. NIBR2454]